MPEEGSEAGTVSVTGRVIHARLLSRKLTFYDLELAEGRADSAEAYQPVSAAASRRQVVICKYPEVTVEALAEIRAQVYLGDVVRMTGWHEAATEPGGGASPPVFHATTALVLQRWRETYPGRSFVPRPVSVRRRREREPACAPCKFWLNSGRCHRVGCPFRHDAPGDALQTQREKALREQKRAKQEDFASNMALLEVQHGVFRPGPEREGDPETEAGDPEAEERHEGAHPFVPKRLRAKVFCDFLLEAFGAEHLTRGTGVIDVAGGRGEVSFELHTRRGIPCTCVDPRPAKLSKEQQRHLKEHPEARRPAHLQAYFGPGMLAEHRQLLEGASCVVAMHPDEATEIAVDYAIERGLPWAVVPCCVFSRSNPQRRTPEGAPVITYEQFLAYLKAKDSRAESAAMAFAGRNIVIFRRPAPP